MKPWYKSKIFLLASIMSFTALSQFYTQWIGGQISPDQYNVVANNFPELANQIKTSVETNNYFAVISAIGSFVIAIWRAWFTTGSKLQF